jgi:hypothetical protein
MTAETEWKPAEKIPINIPVIEDQRSKFSEDEHCPIKQEPT